MVLCPREDRLERKRRSSRKRERTTKKNKKLEEEPREEEGSVGVHSEQRARRRFSLSRPVSPAILEDDDDGNEDRER